MGNAVRHQGGESARSHRHRTQPDGRARGLSRHAGGSAERAQARARQRGRHRVVPHQRQVGAPRHRRRHGLRSREGRASQEIGRTSLDARAGRAHRRFAPDPINTREGNGGDAAPTRRKEGRAAPRAPQRASSQGAGMSERPERAIRILLADASRITTMGIRQVIEKESDMEIIGVASDGEEAVAKTNELEPDVLVIGVDAPWVSGIQATQRVRRELPAVGVIILTAQDQEQILFEAIRAGAAAYLHKDCEPTELIDAIRKVRAGQFIINEKIFSRPAVASKVLAEFRELSVYGPGSTHVFAPLSPREVQILDNIAQGMTNKEVAYALAISEQTVKNHMSSILRKLSVNDRTQAVVYAIRQGWIKGPEIGN